MDNIIVYGKVVDGKAVLVMDGVTFELGLMRPELPIVRVVQALKQVAINNRELIRQYKEGLL